jgi:hypothetical protein
MKSKRILGFLILVFIASLIYAYLQMPQQERVTTGEQRSQAQKQQQRQKGATTGNGGYPRLRNDLLERKSEPYPGVRRNLFSAAFPSGKGKEEVEVLPEVILPPVIAVTPPPPPPTPTPTPQEIVRQELGRYKFVGFLKKGEKRTIFLASNGEILLVRKGDYLGRDRRYFVVNITDTTLELRKDGAGDFSIKLTDQEALSAVPLFSSPAMAPVISGPGPQEQERYQPEQPEFLPVPDSEPQTEDQLQPEEDKP